VIEIPGYRILRQLGRGGMATVYLALQESVQREVALKVMSASLQADPDFSERFLREARIAAKLHHRHVVGIHDVGRAGEANYIAMEYLGGGPVQARDAGPRSVGFALRVTREIGLALHYAHAKGFVHRDVKPDNILLREDGSAALTDFGIARAADSSTRMTRTGAVIGTPHYMSPEQARGRPIDGRADLYSLGIVLYELLVGRVPFHADDSLAVGIMHITQPIPVLPEHLAPIQTILNRLLAKQPDERYQSGQQLADAIEQVEIAIANGDLREFEDPDAAYLRDVPGAAPAPSGKRVITPAPGLRQRERAEPSIGRMDDVVAAARWRPRGASARTPQPAGSRRYLIIVVLLLLLAGGAGAAWFYQDRLRALLPSTELNTLIARGQKALGENRLVGTQGDSARELFQKARALDPDNEQARRGLDNVGARLIEQARAALARNDFEAARTDAAAAEEVLGGGPEVEQIKATLHTAETRNTATEDLLQQGDTALAAGRLIGVDGASTFYQRVLDADATNSLALNGLKKVAETQTAQAHEAINAGNADLANQRIAELAQLSPNHPAIAELRAALAKMHETDVQALDQQLAKAEAQLRAGKIDGPEGAQALFLGAIKRDPANTRAKAGLRRVAQAFVIQANAALDDHNNAAAEKLLRQAEAIAPELADLKAARSRLREERERIDIEKNQSKAAPADQARIDALLEEAEKAVAAGNLNVPPGDSAYDKYRAVLALDGNNARAFAGLSRIPVRAKELFEQALKAGTPNKAYAYLDAIGDLSPGDNALPAMRERLANVFLDQAEVRVGQGLRAEATRALASARELSPNNARISAVDQKIQAMPGAPAPPAGN
jgi:tetratricopeptide (TPR) repeat protein